MFKSILAVSEGGPDAAMAYALAARVAGLFDASVDALHLPVGQASSAIAGFAMTAEALPVMMELDDDRMAERAKTSQGAFDQFVKPLAGSTYSESKTPTVDMLIAMGRCSDLIVLGRPGADPENGAPISVDAAIYECARPIMVAPPLLRTGGFNNAVVAWNGSFQAARAVNYALPLLRKCRAVTILVIGAKPDEVNASLLARSLERHGIASTADAIDPGAVSARARGRALIRYTQDKNADLLVMGAYGRGHVMSFLGLGGATGKVIASSRIPLLMAH